MKIDPIVCIDACTGTEILNDFLFPIPRTTKSLGCRHLYIHIYIYIYIYKKRGARNETKRIALVNGDLIAKIRRLFSRLGCYGVSSSRIDRAKPAARIGSTWQS